MGIESFFSARKSLAVAGLALLSACAMDEPLAIKGSIDMSKIPKEHVFEAVHYGTYKQEPIIESGKIVEKIEHKCSKKENLEYCILKKTMFADSEDEYFSKYHEEDYVVTIVDHGKRRLIFAKTAATEYSIRVGEFTNTVYIPFGNNLHPYYLNTKFPKERWEEFVNNPFVPMEKFSPNKIDEFTKEQLSLFNEMRFLPMLKDFVESLSYYLTMPIRKTFSLCCLE